MTDAWEREAILELIGSVSGMQILDVGCGDGELGLALAQAGASFAGVDADSRALDAARDRFSTAGVRAHLHQADAHALPFESNSFDVITAVTVLCFVRAPERALAEMARVLKPGGRMVLGKLVRYSLWAAWRRLRGWLGHARWRVAQFRTASELHDLVVGADLAVQSTRAAVFYPPIGLIATILAPADRWLGRRIVTGGAFILLAATKPNGKSLESNKDA